MTLWDLIDKYPGGSLAVLIIICCTLVLCVCVRETRNVCVRETQDSDT